MLKGRQKLMYVLCLNLIWLSEQYTRSVVYWMKNKIIQLLLEERSLVTSLLKYGNEDKCFMSFRRHFQKNTEVLVEM
jgi:saccharopine dehydrogenase-like NADP-dependent oxidoreductase